MRPVQTPEAEFDWQLRDAAELAAFKAAVEEALADPRGISHEEVEAWIRKVAAGDFDAPMPAPYLFPERNDNSTAVDRRDQYRLENATYSKNVREYMIKN